MLRVLIIFLPLLFWPSAQAVAVQLSNQSFTFSQVKTYSKILAGNRFLIFIWEIELIIHLYRAKAFFGETKRRVSWVDSFFGGVPTPQDPFSRALIELMVFIHFSDFLGNCLWDFPLTPNANFDFWRLHLLPFRAWTTATSTTTNRRSTCVWVWRLFSRSPVQCSNRGFFIDWSFKHSLVYMGMGRIRGSIWPYRGQLKGARG